MYILSPKYTLSSKPPIYNIAPNNLTKDVTCRVSDCLNLVKIGFEFQGGYISLHDIKD